MFPTISRRSLAGLIASSIVARTSQAASTLPVPTGKSILTISGNIAVTNLKDSAIFDLAMLEGLGEDGFQTMTPWYTEPVRFDGIKMARLMQVVGAKGSSVTAFALNDYTTVLPMGDFEKYGPILAIKRNGSYMPVRDKGPLFIVYPFDSVPELKSQQFYSRSAWQVAKLVVA